MALFRRNKLDNAVAVPEEVSSYYQAENRERTWMAWLLALVTLAVTAIVIIGLFFGGRWIYRKVRHTSSTTTSVVTQKAAQPTKSNEPATNTGNSSSNSTSTTPTSSTGTTAPASGTVNAPTSPSSGTAASGSSTPSATTSTPAANTNLPNTGPGDMLGVFVVVSLAVYCLHRRLQNN